MKRIIGALAMLLFLGGCYPLNKEHYNDVVNVDSNFEELKEKNQRIAQELKEIEGAIRQRDAATGEEK